MSKVLPQMEARVDRDLLQKLDSVRTPGMEDFEICHGDINEMKKQVKLIALRKKFRMGMHLSAKEMLWFSCAMSPYFDAKPGASCPFRLRYRFDGNTEEFYLMDFDEMHNHPLEWDTAMIPLPKKFNHFSRFPTPNFDRDWKDMQAPDANDLKRQLLELGAKNNFFVK